MVIAVASLALGATAAQGKIAQLSGLLGVDAAKAIFRRCWSEGEPPRRVVARSRTVVGFVTLIVGADGRVMIEAAGRALNTVWKVRREAGPRHPGHHPRPPAVVRDRPPLWLLAAGLVGPGARLPPWPSSTGGSAASSVWCVIARACGFEPWPLARARRARLRGWRIFAILPDVKIASGETCGSAAIVDVGALSPRQVRNFASTSARRSVASTLWRRGLVARIPCSWTFTTRRRSCSYGAEFTRGRARQRVRHARQFVADDNAVAVPGHAPGARRSDGRSSSRAER